jgi:hypothetical protein
MNAGLTEPPDPDYDRQMIRARFAGKLLFLCVLAVAVLILIRPGRAADAETDAVDAHVPSLEGLYFDWSLYELQENGNRVCYLSSGLERSSDNVPRRRPAYVLITNRPAESKRGIVSINPGLPYDDGSSVLMSIGRKQFQLFASNGTAWAGDGDDQQIIAAIRHGSTLVVTGRMKSGPTTTDTFSLKGFPAALVALDQACPVAGAQAAEPVVHRHRHRKKK